MFSTDFLLSLPGGAEWLFIIFLLVFLIICPVLAIVYFLQAKSLKKENKVLLDKLLEKNKQPA
jgi:hypothetical protein